MKSSNIIFRVTESEKQEIKKAATGKKSVTAFLLWAVKTVYKNRRLLAIAAEIESGGLSPVKLLEMAAKVELANTRGK
jgi:hypothetical protein